MAVSMNLGGFSMGLGMLQRGLGLISSSFRADPDENHMAVTTNWESLWWVSL